MTSRDILDPAHTALVIVDVQNDFCHEEGSMAKQGLDTSMAREMIPQLKQLIQQARDFHVPIIFIQTIHETSTDSETWIRRLKDKSHANVCRKNTWGSEFFELTPTPEDIIVIKHRYSAFINTRLDSILRTLKIRTLLMAGVSTNVCVESTARDGFMLDYDIVFLSDCTAAFSEKAHLMTLENIDLFFGQVMASNQVIENGLSLDRIE
ncbi:isochorismatase family protein [Terrilactibacillus sp. BCM23-1]|uniref:Isochorismatase family protein n=1 Tax=Terrilactibacillus tamarindi TaxID=2599694 RepID=A0A6N8CPY6_9BACI|nr:isochorismatase family cysteine hydrolase [Terrilactibacillus tamarindi]MTT31718.1 isochorismatase family protein [Terrilactibacillus tamarindi]